MTTTARCLVEAKYAENAQTQQYIAASGMRTILDRISAFSAAGGTISFNIVASAGAAGASNLLVTKTLAANETYTFPELTNQVLNAGDFVSSLAAAANTVVIRISGREIT